MIPEPGSPPPAAPALTLREVGLDGLPQLRACVVALQDAERALEPSMPPGESIADRYLLCMAERCAGDRGRVVVAELGGEVVGFASVLFSVEPEGPDDPPDPYAFLSDIVVLPGHRGLGVGHRLLARIEELARTAGAGELRLTVLSANQGARRLYASAGFREWLVELVKPLTTPRPAPHRGASGSAP